MMYGQMTAGSWIYIGSQGIVQGTYETFVEVGRQHFGGSLKGKWILTGGLGGMGGAQPLAATMAGASMLAVECDESRIDMRLRTRYLDAKAGSLDAYAMRQALVAEVEQELPAPGHVEQPALGMEAPRALLNDRGAVIHAVPVLRHARVHFGALGHWRAPFRAGRKLKHERLADCDFVRNRPIGDRNPLGINAHARRQLACRRGDGPKSG